MSVRKILVTDFDGTITDEDFYQLLIAQYLPADAPDYWGLYGRGEITHFEAMRGIFSHAPEDAAALDRLLGETRPDPELGAAMARLQAAGWEVAIASAGSSWYIDRVLERAGVRGVAVHANLGAIERGRGLWIWLPEESPFLSREVGIDKSGIVRDALGRAEVVAFAGDGPPDLEPALLVGAEWRFARGWLARELTRRGEGFRPYRRWSEMARVLVA